MFTHHTTGYVFDPMTHADVSYCISFHSTSAFTYFYVGRMQDIHSTWWPIEFHAVNGSIDQDEAIYLADAIAADSLRKRRRIDP